MLWRFDGCYVSCCVDAEVLGRLGGPGRGVATRNGSIKRAGRGGGREVPLPGRGRRECREWSQIAACAAEAGLGRTGHGAMSTWLGLCLVRARGRCCAALPYEATIGVRGRRRAAIVAGRCALKSIRSFAQGRRWPMSKADMPYLSKRGQCADPAAQQAQAEADGGKQAVRWGTRSGGRRPQPSPAAVVPLLRRVPCPRSAASITHPARQLGRGHIVTNQDRRTKRHQNSTPGSARQQACRDQQRETHPHTDPQHGAAASASRLLRHPANEIPTRRRPAAALTPYPQPHSRAEARHGHGPLHTPPASPRRRPEHASSASSSGGPSPSPAPSPLTQPRAQPPRHTGPGQATQAGRQAGVRSCGSRSCRRW